MVKYTLLHKPTISSWPTIPRQLKVILAGSAIITMIFLVIVQSSRNVHLTTLYKLHATLVEILNQELQYLPQDEPMKDKWTQSAVPEGMIYSAYLDARPEIVLDNAHGDGNGARVWGVIRIIAILPLKLDGSELTCYYKYRSTGKDGNPIQTRPTSQVKAIEENWGLTYSAFFVLCDLTIPYNLNYHGLYYDRHLPMEIGLGTDEEDAKNMKFVRVHYPKNGIAQTNTDSQDFLATCGPVFHHDYDRALHLVEYVEYHRMMGVGHFTFYNRSVTPDVNRVFSFYSSKGLASIMQWQLPDIYKFELTLRVDGSFAAMNDCLYRSAFYNDYKYLLVSDIDEFLIPRKHEDLRQLIEYLDPTDPNASKHSHASFIFRNVFFYLMYNDDVEHKDPAMPYLYLQAKTTRVTEPEKARFRSKYIVRGRDVVEIGNHNVWENRPGSSAFSEGFDESVVDTDVAMSHHYRDCEAETTACYLRPTVIDRIAHKFVDKLGKRVSQVCGDIFGKKGCPAPTN